jgi:hypothetical protein
MAVSTFRFVAVGLLVFCASSASAVTSVKTVSLLHNNTNSPFFKTTADGLNTFNNYSDSGGTFTPVGDPRAGESTSITTNGVFSIVGNSTSAGGWTNNNGVPKGITLTFNTQITYSVGAGSPAGSYLSLTENGANRGNGMGITQTLHGVSTIDSSNLNEVPGSGADVFAASAVAVSDIHFSGNLTETGFAFTPGTVGNFGPFLLRSAGFSDTNETAGLVSETGPSDPLGQGRPTIGFGVPSSDPSEAGRGEGIVQSFALIRNTFAEQTIAGPPLRSTFFPRQIGAFTLTPQNGTLGFKGISYAYDVTFGVVPIPPGDYNKNGVVDAADYVLWRKGDLAADSNGDTLVDQVDYDFWRANFGSPSPGAGAGLSGASVPEPASLILVVVGLLGTCSWRRFDRMRS